MRGEGEWLEGLVGKQRAGEARDGSERRGSEQYACHHLSHKSALVVILVD